MRSTAAPRGTSAFWSAGFSGEISPSNSIRLAAVPGTDSTAARKAGSRPLVFSTAKSRVRLISRLVSITSRLRSAPVASGAPRPIASALRMPARALPGSPNGKREMTRGVCGSAETRCGHQGSASPSCGSGRTPTLAPPSVTARSTWLAVPNAVIGVKLP